MNTNLLSTSRCCVSRGRVGPRTARCPPRALALARLWRDTTKARFRGSAFPWGFYFSSSATCRRHKSSCSAACQRAHWKRGGHKKECEAIAERGGAEQFYGILNVISADDGDDHATTIGLRFQAAQAVYKMHFFGREDYRRDLIQSITMHGGFHEHSARVLGEDHPLTREIAQGFLTCFDEQLDWSLDDIPDDYLAYRAKLLGE